MMLALLTNFWMENARCRTNHEVVQHQRRRLVATMIDSFVPRPKKRSRSIDPLQTSTSAESPRPVVVVERPIICRFARPPCRRR
jgi:hypothetical protein